MNYINYISYEFKPAIMNSSCAQLYAILSEKMDKKVAESITSSLTNK